MEMDRDQRKRQKRILKGNKNERRIECLNEDNYKEETPKKTSRMSSINCQKEFIRGNPVSIVGKKFV